MQCPSCIVTIIICPLVTASAFAQEPVVVAIPATQESLHKQITTRPVLPRANLDDITWSRFVRPGDRARYQVRKYSQVREQTVEPDFEIDGHITVVFEERDEDRVTGHSLIRVDRVVVRGRQITTVAEDIARIGFVASAERGLELDADDLSKLKTRGEASAAFEHLASALQTLLFEFPSSPSEAANGWIGVRTRRSYTASEYEGVSIVRSDSVGGPGVSDALVESTQVQLAGGLPASATHVLSRWLDGSVVVSQTTVAVRLP